MSELADEVETDVEGEVEADEYPWSIIPDWVTLAPISELAYRIYGILRAHANKEKGGRTSFPSQKRLAAILGYAKPHPIGLAINELRSIGAVTTRTVPCPRGKKTIYKTHLEPRPGVEYEGQRMTSQLTEGALAAMAEARAKRPNRRGKGCRPSAEADA